MKLRIPRGAPKILVSHRAPVPKGQVGHLLCWPTPLLDGRIGLDRVSLGLPTSWIDLALYSVFPTIIVLELCLHQIPAPLKWRCGPFSVLAVPMFSPGKASVLAG
jgi:hypothetical protein